MSDVEYVVNFGSDKSPQFVRLSMAEIEHHGARLRQPIVRCLDCKHYREHVFVVITNVDHVCMLFAEGVKVEPNGFCAWGERRDT